MTDERKLTERTTPRSRSQTCKVQPLVSVQLSSSVDGPGGDEPASARGLTLKAVEGGPHAIAWKHSDQVNQAHTDFLN